MNEIKNQQPINYRNILLKSVSLIAYAFVFISLILITSASFVHYQLAYLVYLIPLLLITLLIYLYKKPFWGIITLVFLLPFHAFLWMTIRNHFGLTGDQSFWIAFWKEALIIIIILVIISKSIIQKKLPFKIITLDWLIFILFILGGLSILYGTKNLSQGLWGLRTDFEFFLTYFIARSIIRNKYQLKILFITILGSGFLVVIFGILQTYYWLPDFLTRFGYTLNAWTPNGPLQAYQTVDNLIRIISTFSGAIQLGPYLAILILLALSLALFIKNKLIKVFLVLFSVICLFPLYYTFTRSAWLGLIVGLFVLFLIIIKDKINLSHKRIISLLLVIIFLCLLGFGSYVFFKSNILYEQTFFNKFFYHGSSTFGHTQGIIESLKIIKDNPLGLGLGKSGLVTLRFNQRFLSENWYLQITTEMGVLALIIFIAIMIIFIRLIYLLYRDGKDLFIKGLSLGTLLSFICFSVVGFFLHAWGDNTVVALIFWILAGGLIEYHILNKNSL